jgi:acyl dehydratase
MAQVYYEDVEVGTELPPLQKEPTTTTLVRWAGASGDYAVIHFDKDLAMERGFSEGVIIHGKLKFAWLGQLVTDWIGTKGSVKKMTCQYRGQDRPGDIITCRGEVSNKYVEDGEHYVECRIWTENQKGVTSTPGTATVVLPSKG